jgi:hypothetical protein
MTDYDPAAVTVDGVAPSVHSAASGDKLTSPGDGRWLRIINGSGSSITCTITPPGTTSYNVDNPDKVFTVANGASRLVPVLRAYGDPADGGKVALAWSATSSVTFEYNRI